jgi:hypothetical protein
MNEFQNAYDHFGGYENASMLIHSLDRNLSQLENHNDTWKQNQERIVIMKVESCFLICLLVHHKQNCGAVFWLRLIKRQNNCI